MISQCGCIVATTENYQQFTKPDLQTLDNKSDKLKMALNLNIN
jgi:hypothetical protein